MERTKSAGLPVPEEVAIVSDTQVGFHDPTHYGKSKYIGKIEEQEIIEDGNTYLEPKR
jgi:hypothetical protein